MKALFLKLYCRLRDLAGQDEGQDLVEYALVVALVAFGATAGMSHLAAGINVAFDNISTKLATDITCILA
jgi:pilus assembly protein Flp/PilA